LIGGGYAGPDLDEERPYVILLARPLPIPTFVNRGSILHKIQ